MNSQDKLDEGIEKKEERKDNEDDAQMTHINLHEMLPKEGTPIEEESPEKKNFQTTFKVEKNDDLQQNNSAGIGLTSSKTDGSNASVEQWLSRYGWSRNPFTFSINPQLFVGYDSQLNKITNSIREKHKISMVIGPTGSGKTSFLKKIELSNKFEYIYIGKPPSDETEFVKIFNEKFKSRWYLRWLIPNIKNIYQVPSYLNKKLKAKHLVILFDESHEAEIDILEWLRVLSDQIDNMSIVLSGLPVFEDKIRTSLESLNNRIAAKVELVSLTKEETVELIRKRIEYAGGSGIEPFGSMIDQIYSKTRGYPREIIRFCDNMINDAMEHGETELRDRREEPVVIKEEHDAGGMSMSTIDRMTPMQKTVIEMLLKPLTPGQIADNLGTMKYKTRQHAVRSINNILKDLMKDGFVERRRRDRAYVYELNPSLRNLIAKS